MNISDPKIRKTIAAELGRSGGKQRAQNLSPERRTEIAKAGAKARWHEARLKKPTEFLSP